MNVPPPLPSLRFRLVILKLLAARPAGAPPPREVR